ncbi:MAG TPA: DUF1801 domain-containing protein [Terriglobales bacterium]|nr:DUF1801 domain-containing protein [Terriglobales bacterium]
MQSRAASVSAYLKELPSDRKVPLAKLRQLCKQALKNYEEAIEYGMPGYKRNGMIEVAFASQKQYVALYVLKKDVLDRHRKALPGCEIGKGCIRFRKADQIDFEAVLKLLRDVAGSKSKPC